MRIGQKFGNSFSEWGPISPFLFGQFGVKNVFHLPELRDLPYEGIQFKIEPFTFGTFLPNDATGIPAMDVANINRDIQVPCLIWALAGLSNDLTGPGATNSGFTFQVFHTHEGKQYQWFQKHVHSGVLLGNGKFPYMLTRPHLLLPADCLRIEVRNFGSPVAPATTSVQILLFGGEFHAG